MKWQELVTLAATLLLAGWVSAFITQLIKREAWPSAVKLVLAIVVAFLVGLATVWLSGDLTAFIGKWGSLTSADVLTFGTLVFASAQVWYHKFFDDQAWAQNLGKWPK